MSNIYTWNTAKTSTGYKWNVTKMVTRATPNDKGRYSDDEVVKTGIKATRAQAKGIATRWAKCFKQAA